MYTYPIANRDDPGHVLGLLGSLWRLYYSGSTALMATVQGNLANLAQQRQNLSEAVACISKHDIPLWHKEHWTPLRIQNKQASVPKLVRMPLIVNRIARSTLILFEGIDYHVRDNVIAFEDDPAGNSLIANDGSTCYLWGFGGQFDTCYLREHFGYWLGLDVQSCARDKAIAGAVIDCMVNGATVANLTRLLAAILDVPIADGPETVICDAVDRRGRFLATERHVHRIATDAPLTAPEGVLVCAGQPLLQVFELRELRQLAADAAVTVPASMTNAENDTTIVAGDLQMSSCVAICLRDTARAPEVLRHVRLVMPPQTGVVFTELESNNAISDSTDATGSSV